MATIQANYNDCPQCKCNVVAGYINMLLILIVNIQLVWNIACWQLSTTDIKYFICHCGLLAETKNGNQGKHLGSQVRSLSQSTSATFISQRMC